MCMTSTAARQAAARLSCPLGTRSRVFGPAREHHVVDDQRVLARCEQLREPHLAAIGRGLEDVVLPDEAARWERPALGCDLGQAATEPQRHLVADRVEEDRVFISVISFAEIRRGVEMLPTGRREQPPQGCLCVSLPLPLSADTTTTAF